MLQVLLPPVTSRQDILVVGKQAHGELCNYFIIYYNVITIEIEYIIHVMPLNHSKTILYPWLMEKLSSTKLVSGAKKLAAHLALASSWLQGIDLYGSLPLCSSLL